MPSTVSRHGKNNTIMSYSELQRPTTTPQPVVKSGRRTIAPRLFKSLLDIIAIKDNNDLTKHTKENSWGDQKTRAREAALFLMSKGWGKIQAAAAIGNLIQEAGLAPSIVNSIGAVGIAQWLGVRKKQFLATKGNTPMERELNWLLAEQGDKQIGNAWLSKADRDEFFKATDLDKATTTWLLKFERPGAHERAATNRIKFARAVYDDLSGKKTTLLDKNTAAAWLEREGRRIPNIMDVDLGFGFLPVDKNGWDANIVRYGRGIPENNNQWNPVAAAVMSHCTTRDVFTRLLSITDALQTTISEKVRTFPSFSGGQAGIDQALQCCYEMNASYARLAVPVGGQKGFDANTIAGAKVSASVWCFSVMARIALRAGFHPSSIVSALSRLRISDLNCLKPSNAGGIAKIQFKYSGALLSSPELKGLDGLAQIFFGLLVDPIIVGIKHSHSAAVFSEADSFYLTKIASPQSQILGDGSPVTYLNVLGVNTIDLHEFWRVYQTLLV